MAQVAVDGVDVRKRPMTRELKRVILASSAGTVFDWYDFYLYGSLAAIIGVGIVGLVAASVVAARNAVALRGDGLSIAEETGDHDSNIRQLARSIFGDYVVAFEITSVLLVVAVVGTVVLTRRMRSSDDSSTGSRAQGA
jgi:NADH:ubiquinone oxidoreductase subunit 6 (subunit J)